LVTAWSLTEATTVTLPSAKTSDGGARVVARGCRFLQFPRSPKSCTWLWRKSCGRAADGLSRPGMLRGLLPAGWEKRNRGYDHTSGHHPEQPQDDQESNSAPLPPACTICCCPCRRSRTRPIMHMPDASPQWFASFLILLCSTFIYYVRICLFVSFPIFQRCDSVDFAMF
jgi:hypothetical protein